MQISKIQLEKKNPKSFGLYEGNTLLTVVSEDTLVHFALSKGVELDSKQLQRITHFDKRQKCINQAYSYLKRRPHLRKELFNKLYNKNIEINTINETLEWLAEKGYLDDKEFISLFIKDALRQRKSGPNLIKKKLIEKGAKIPEVELILQEIYDEKAEFDIAQEVIIKKNQKLSTANALERKKKLTHFATGRGFRWEIINGVLQGVEM